MKSVFLQTNKETLNVFVEEGHFSVNILPANEPDGGIPVWYGTAYVEEHDPNALHVQMDMSILGSAGESIALTQSYPLPNAIAKGFNRKRVMLYLKEPEDDEPVHS